MSGGYKRKIPGWWRLGEALREVEKQTGIKLPKWKWDYLLETGVIPPGIGRTILADGSTSLQQIWSDKQLYLDVIPAIQAHEERGRAKRASDTCDGG